ncbi:beta-1,4-galactosyltransferase galt-1-like isoform X2 [Clarias magur]|uniref:Glycosyltransferase family 92 protein n=1 Tax=Clarias magur TaxID=1594786 RepID=A0A8J4TSU3_CLAMG|nr:beta-1,4-galactosyltransferase galt-1-like isoform X2 [Clarias magur]
MMRTIAIVLRSEDAQYDCLLCCNGTKESVPATREIHSDHFGFEYGTADITCQLPVTCTKPTHVAITSQPVKENGSSQDIHVFQPVRNQEIPETFPYEFAVCISVMFDYNNVLELVQAIEMFKILGVQKVAIYKTSCNSNVQKVLDYYIKQKFVELIPWKLSPHINASRGWLKSVSSGQLHYFGQIPALNDCVYRYMYQSRYVSLQDLDELILPMNVKTWKELLPDLERKYNHIGAFEFENNYFSLSLKDSNPKYSPESWKNVPGVNILEHIVRLSNKGIHKYEQFKTIVDPRIVVQATVHGLLKSMKGIVWVDSNIARMYHMRNISNENFKESSQVQDTHLRDYADSLIPAVSKVLQEALGIN